MEKSSMINIKARGRIPVYVILDNSTESLASAGFLEKRDAALEQFFSGLSSIECINGISSGTPAMVSLLSFGGHAELLLPSKFLQKRDVRGACAHAVNYLPADQYCGFSHHLTSGTFALDQSFSLISELQNKNSVDGIDSPPLIVLFYGKGAASVIENGEKLGELTSLASETTSRYIFGINLEGNEYNLPFLQNVSGSEIAERIEKSAKLLSASINAQFMQNSSRIDLFPAPFPDSCLSQYRKESSAIFFENGKKEYFCFLIISRNGANVCFNNCQIDQKSVKIQWVHDPFETQNKISVTWQAKTSAQILQVDGSEGITTFSLQYTERSSFVSGIPFLLQISFQTAKGENCCLFVHAFSLDLNNNASLPAGKGSKESAGNAVPAAKTDSQKKKNKVLLFCIFLLIAAVFAAFTAINKNKKQPESVPQPPQSIVEEKNLSIQFNNEYDGHYFGPSEIKLEAVCPENPDEEIVWELLENSKEDAVIEKNGILNPVKHAKDVFIRAYLKNHPDIHRDVTMKSITVSIVENELKGSGQLTAALAPYSAVPQKITWETEYSDIIELQKSGAYKVKREGDILVYLSVDEVKIEKTLHCIPSKIASPFMHQKLTSVTISDEKLEDRGRMNFRCEPESFTYESFVWETRNSDIVELQKDGSYEVKREGDAWIYLTVDGVETNKKLRCIPPKLISVTISDKELKNSGKMNFEWKPERITPKDIVWETPDRNIIDLKRNGVYEVKRAGDARVYLTVDGVKTEKTVRCTAQEIPPEPPQKLKSVTISDRTLKNSGRMTFEPLPENIKLKNIVWGTSDSSIVALKQDGSYEVKRVGDALIYLTVDGVKTEKKVHCTPSEEKFLIKQIASGENFVTLRLRGEFDSVEWTSADTDLAEIYDSMKRQRDCKIHIKKSGTVEIFAKIDNEIAKSYQLTCSYVPPFQPKTAVEQPKAEEYSVLFELVFESGVNAQAAKQYLIEQKAGLRYRLENQWSDIPSEFTWEKKLKKGHYGIRVRSSEKINLNYQGDFNVPNETLVKIPIQFNASRITFKNESGEQNVRFYLNGREYRPGDVQLVPSFKSCTVDIYNINWRGKEKMQSIEIKSSDLRPNQTYACTANFRIDNRSIKEKFAEQKMLWENQNNNWYHWKSDQEKKNREDIKNELKKLAEEYDEAAYYMATKVCDDEKESRRYYLKAADMGNFKSMEDITNLVWGGSLNIPHEKLADYLEKLAVRKNDVKAQMRLGEAFKDGSHGFPYAPETAAAYLEKAAKNDNVQAMYLLGCMYESGLGVPRDETLAQNYFAKAAAAGHPEAAKKKK